MTEHIAGHSRDFALSVERLVERVKNVEDHDEGYEKKVKDRHEGFKKNIKDRHEGFEKKVKRLETMPRMAEGRRPL